ncbi:MAG: 4-(cytidine 5'-diphospho)-2-C-methyl-D-erythritol kinase [Phycisphaerales bacterium]|nr:4-(cytidine 5'-diphospho)-2-C-methyl-D-erythritol kinase [Phycisphaerales bacterium]
MIRFDTTTALCPAKINLTLRVHPRRADGFHDLESLVAQLEFGDELSVVRRADSNITLRCDDQTVPIDESNLVKRAARAFQAAAPRAIGADFDLKKRIPPGSGLGGGSSNAAAALRVLNHLAEWPFERARLMELGASVGSDVALFFGGQACVMRGRGERIEPMRLELPLHLVLVLSALQCSTAEVYRRFDELPPPPARPAVPPLASKGGMSAKQWMEALHNDLEPAAFATCPALRELAVEIQERTGLAVRMSGSGSALFRLFDDDRGARRFAESVESIGDARCVVTEFAK